MDARARQHAAVLAFGRCTNVQPNLSVVTQDAAALVAEILEAPLSGAGEVVAAGADLMLKVGSTGPQGKTVNVATHQFPLRSEDSMAGYALHTANPVVTSNLASEKRYDDVFLNRLGVVSALTVPLHLGRKPFGTLGVYNKRERQFTSDDVGFAETIAHLLTSSIARHEAERALREQSTLASAVLEMVDEFVLVLDPRGKLVSMNRACQQTTGLPIEAVRGQSFLEALVAPEQTGAIRDTLRRASDEKSPCQFESHLLVKNGTRRCISWSLKPLCDECEAVQSIVLTGVDRTKQIAAEKELQRAKAAAEEADRMLKELQREAGAEDHPAGHPTAPSDDAPSEEFPGAGDGGTGQAFRPVGGKPAKELRTSPRRTYRCRQLIAPMCDGVIPLRSKFFEVECGDISAGGISFYLENAPKFRDLVVGLGQPPSLTYFSAYVVRVMEKVVDGRQVHLVGCRFTGRLHL